MLTIFETDVEAGDLDRAFKTMDLLRQHDVPCPVPIRTKHGAASFVLGLKLAALVTFVEGNNSTEPGIEKCRRLAEATAQIHIALNQRERGRVSARDSLARGWVHGALTKKNVMFTGDQVTGVINFRLRHTDFLVSELADVAVEWSSTGGEIDLEKLAAILASYHRVRPLSAVESEGLPLMVVSAAAKAIASRNMRIANFDHLGANVAEAIQRSAP